MGFKKGLLFYKKSLSYPSSLRVLECWLMNPRADRVVWRRISVSLSKESFSPGPSFFSSYEICFLDRGEGTGLIHKRPDRMSFLLFRGGLRFSFVF